MVFSTPDSYLANEYLSGDSGKTSQVRVFLHATCKDFVPSFQYGSPPLTDPHVAETFIKMANIHFRASTAYWLRISYFNAVNLTFCAEIIDFLENYKMNHERHEKSYTRIVQPVCKNTIFMFFVVRIHENFFADICKKPFSEEVLCFICLVMSGLKTGTWLYIKLNRDLLQVVHCKKWVLVYPKHIQNDKNQSSGNTSDCTD